MILNNLVSEYGRELQEIPLKKINWENDFYQHIGRLVNDSTTDPTVLKSFRNRSQVKKTMMLLLYDNYDNKRPPYYNEFKRHFPDETKIMDSIKANQERKIFPTILQAVEAKIMLEICCKEIDIAYPGLPTLTVHDSIVCDVSHLQEIRTILETTLIEHVGSVPGLKEEVIDQDTVMNHIQQTVNEDWDEIIKDLKTVNSNPDWVGSFNQDPKDIMLKESLLKVNGKIILDKRILNPQYPRDEYSEYFDEEEDWDEK